MTPTATEPVTFDEEDAILDGLLAFIDRAIVPLQESLHEYFDDSRRYFDESGREAPAIADAHRQVRLAAAKAGYYTLFTPVELGGQGLSRRLQASHQLRDEVLPKLLSGEIRSSFALSEPDAGTDIWNMRTTARRDGDSWIINGQKQWASWVAEADFLFLFAVTDPERRDRRAGGITCFYVPTDTPGYELSSVIRLFNDPGGREGILSFTDMRIPDAWRIGEIGEGITAAFLTLTTTRLWLAARCLGEAFWAYDRCLEYAKARQTFGQAIAEHQSIQNLLADMVTDLYSSHTMAMDCAAHADAGIDVRAETAMVKYHATNTAVRVHDDAMQIHGGMGFASETKLADGWRFARISRMTEGSDQMMQRTIAGLMLKRGLPDWGSTTPRGL